MLVSGQPPSGIATPWDPNEIQRKLAQCLNRPVSLVLTENSTCMLSARERNNVLRIRLHRMFTYAQSQVIEEIVSYLKTKSIKMPLFHAFIRENRGHLRTRSPKKTSLRTSGNVHDLHELSGEVNKAYFGGVITAAITWGSKSPRSSVKKRTLGSYSERSNIIRVNPVLDRTTVPRYYIAFVVYHEMLHAAMGTPMQGNRRCIHSREFRRRERLFSDYQRARAFEHR